MCFYGCETDQNISMKTVVWKIFRNQKQNIKAFCFTWVFKIKRKIVTTRYIYLTINMILVLVCSLQLETDANIILFTITYIWTYMCVLLRFILQQSYISDTANCPSKEASS